MTEPTSPEPAVPVPIASEIETLIGRAREALDNLAPGEVGDVAQSLRGVGYAVLALVEASRPPAPLDHNHADYRRMEPVIVEGRVQKRFICGRCGVRLEGPTK